ncbi:hypothetical protein ACWGIB_23990 [Streptomyces xiamenensis]
MPSAAPRQASGTAPVGLAPATAPAPVAMPVARRAQPAPPAPTPPAPAPSPAPAPKAARTVQRTPSASSPAGAPSVRWQSAAVRTSSDAERSENADAFEGRREATDPLDLSEFQLDQLSRKLISRITRLLRTELRLDRERIGRLRDNRH